MRLGRRLLYSENDAPLARRHRAMLVLSFVGSVLRADQHIKSPLGALYLDHGENSTRFGAELDHVLQPSVRPGPSEVAKFSP